MLPFGLGEIKPKHFREMARVAWENRAELPFAWRILSKGVCDGCALGTSGLSDWTIEGTHLCMVRLEMLRLNTMPALDSALLSDAEALAARSSRDLRELGRLAEPMVRRKGDRGFSALSWDEALDLAASRLRAADPNRIAFYLTSRGITNEVYYAAQKAARFLGTNHVDNSARLCHAASTAAMKGMLGHGASTCSYRDWIGADLIVLFGSNVPNNQPVTTKYLHDAKKNGASIAVVNPYREPGLERYWIPSIPSSALFGTPLADHWFDVDTGGDLGFLTGVLKALLEEPGGIDRDFVPGADHRASTSGGAVREHSWEALERESGAPRGRMQDFARLLIAKPNAHFVWSMGLTQHAHGVATIRALVNVGLARGLPGRPKAGLMPIRGHSGVQGGAEVGCAPHVDGTALDRWREIWGFDPPRFPGRAAIEQIEASAQGKIDVFWIVGGNFLETVPDAQRSRRALERPGLRIHQDIVLSTACLVPPSDTVLLLPAATRYETPGASRRPRRSGASFFARDPGPPDRHGAARVGSASRNRRPGPSARRRRSCAARPGGFCAGDGGTPSRSTPGSRRSRRRETRSSGAARRSTRTAASRRPTARLISQSCPWSAANPAGTSSRCRRAAASSSTRWCSGTGIP